jgi:DsbC/DsbD-like thiol-disulfide interchange protein
MNTKLAYLLLLPLVAATTQRGSENTDLAQAVPMRSGEMPISLRPVRWTVIGGSSARTVAPGRTVPVTLAAEIAKGWHIYSLSQKPGGPIPLSIRLVDSSDAVIRGLIKAPRPERQFDKNFGIETELYSGSPQFTLELGARRPTRGIQDVLLGARYQVCSETLCLPPRTDKLEVRLRIVSRS